MDSRRSIEDVRRKHETVGGRANDALKHNLEVATDTAVDSVIDAADQSALKKAEKRKLKKEKKKLQRAREAGQLKEETSNVGKPDQIKTEDHDNITTSPTKTQKIKVEVKAELKSENEDSSS